MPAPPCTLYLITRAGLAYSDHHVCGTMSLAAPEVFSAYLQILKGEDGQQLGPELTAKADVWLSQTGTRGQQQLLTVQPHLKIMKHMPIGLACASLSSGEAALSGAAAAPWCRSGLV